MFYIFQLSTLTSPVAVAFLASGMSWSTKRVNEDGDFLDACLRI